jgi:hypothetical protein
MVALFTHSIHVSIILHYVYLFIQPFGCQTNKIKVFLCRGVLKSQFIRFKHIYSSFREYNLACFALCKVLRERVSSRRNLLFRRLPREVWLSNVNL